MQLPEDGHVVVCGLHDEGLRLVEQLVGVGVEVVVVDDQPDARLVRQLDGLGVPHLDADSRLAATLTTAGLAGCSALVCVESDDLHTLATALLAHELRPDLRVVVQLRNDAVGRALQDIGVAVLDVARLSVPSIVEVCLRTGRRHLRLPEVDLVLASATCVQPGSLRSLFGDLAPVALVPAEGERVLRPGRDTAVAPGDEVVVVGTPDDLDAAGLGGHRRRTPHAPVFVGARAPRPPRERATWLTDVLRGLDRRVRTAVLALGGLAVLSMTVLMLGYREPDGRRMSLLDALYFTVETMATVGYGDFYFREQQWWLRLWAVLVMALGATLVAIFFALFTNALVTRQLEETLGRRRITGLVDHVVVVGVGSIGLGVVRDLRRQGVEVVVVERDPDSRYLGELRALGVAVIAADATLPETWSRVHLHRARAVAVMTSDDLVNLETGLAVKDLLGARCAEVPVALRLFDRDTARTVARSFGFRHTRSPAALAAPWFVGAALGLEVVDTFYVGDEPLLVARLVVHAGHHLEGVTMADLGADIRVLARVDGSGHVEHPPRRGTRLAAGDAAYLVGPYEELLALLRAEGA